MLNHGKEMVKKKMTPLIVKYKFNFEYSVTGFKIKRKKLREGEVRYRNQATEFHIFQSPVPLNSKKRGMWGSSSDCFEGKEREK